MLVPFSFLLTQSSLILSNEQLFLLNPIRHLMGTTTQLAHLLFYTKVGRIRLSTELSQTHARVL